MPLIGVYVHPWHNYGLDILRGVSRFVARHPGWETYLPWPGALRNYARLPGERLDGVIMRVGGEHDVPAGFAKRHQRVVIANTDQLSVAVDISWDNDAIGRLAGEHLLEQGHRQIVFVGRLASSPYQRQRADGLSKALADQHVGVRVVDLDGLKPAAIKKWIHTLPRPTAIFAASDPIGSELLHLARVMNRRVPEDIAVVAAGDNEIFCEMASPPLSSVALPGEQVGYLAAERLHALLTTGERATPVVVSPRYVTVRRSSEMLAIDDPAIAQAMRVIHDRAADGLTVAEVRKGVPLSRRALELRFKKVVGRTIEQELLRVRLSHAKRLLAGSDLPMADIAERIGLSSAQRLSAVFSREEGESPSAYRRRIRPS